MCVAALQFSTVAFVLVCATYVHFEELFEFLQYFVERTHVLRRLGAPKCKAKGIESKAAACLLVGLLVVG